MNLDWSLLVSSTEIVPAASALALAAPIAGLLLGRLLVWAATPRVYRQGQRVH